MNQFSRIFYSRYTTILPSVISRQAGVWSQVTGFFGGNGPSKARLNVVGNRLYENIADRTDYTRFFLAYNLPNTFNSWFLITELHVWMILTRVMANENEQGRQLRNIVVEALWTDANTRAKQLCSDNPSALRAQLSELSQQFQAALIIYDEGLASNDKVLASALWERFFEKRCRDYGLLEDLVKYVRSEVYRFDLVEYKDIIEDPRQLWPEKETTKPSTLPPLTV